MERKRDGQTERERERGKRETERGEREWGETGGWGRETERDLISFHN